MDKQESKESLLTPTHLAQIRARAETAIQVIEQVEYDVLALLAMIEAQTEQIKQLTLDHAATVCQGCRDYGPPQPTPWNARDEANGEVSVTLAHKVSSVGERWDTSDREVWSGCTALGIWNIRPFVDSSDSPEPRAKVKV